MEWDVSLFPAACNPNRNKIPIMHHHPASSWRSAFFHPVQWYVCIAILLILHATPVPAAKPESITIGGKNFTEQYLLVELAAALLEDRGFNVVKRGGVGSTVARQSLRNDQIDLYYEYTGTAYTVYHHQSDRSIMTNPQGVFDWVAEADAKLGLVWLDRLQLNNTYVILMREQQSRQLDIHTLSDLGQYVSAHPGELVFSVSAEFWERPDGFKPLMERYGFHVPYHKIRRMIPGLIYMALRDGAVDVSMGFATDGRLDAFGFVIIKDNKDYFPVYNPAPVVRESILQQSPEIRDALEPLTRLLTTPEMRRLNYQVDVQHQDAKRVATQWLQNHNLTSTPNNNE